MVFLLLPNLIVHLTITFKTYKVTWVFKNAREPFLADVCFVLKSEFKGQLQRFDKLGLFDRFRHIESGFDIDFSKFFSFSCYKTSKF